MRLVISVKCRVNIMLKAFTISTIDVTNEEMSNQICEILHSIFTTSLKDRYEYDYSYLKVKPKQCSGWDTPYSGDTTLHIVIYSLEQTILLLTYQTKIKDSLLGIIQILNNMKNFNMKILSDITPNKFCYNDLAIAMRNTMDLVIT